MLPSELVSLDVDSLDLLDFLKEEDEAILREKSLSVRSFNDPKLVKFVDLLIDKMRDESAPGIGISSIQVGVAMRLFVIDKIGAMNQDYAKEHNVDLRHCFDSDLEARGYSNSIDELTVFINPKITYLSDDKIPFNEGCLSLLGAHADVYRSRLVHVEYYDLANNLCSGKFYGLPSVCVQHEYDHLEGILYIDHLNVKDRETVIAKMKKRSRREIE
ncbi:peptide deformylase [Anaplasmataceae bacterium AB001_6]|nr:peptide deformylase [Anaplasmataceae bacterium AB001_6]